MADSLPDLQPHMSPKGRQLLSIEADPDIAPNPDDFVYAPKTHPDRIIGFSLYYGPTHAYMDVFRSRNGIIGTVSVYLSC